MLLYKINNPLKYKLMYLDCASQADYMNCTDTKKKHQRKVK